MNVIESKEWAREKLKEIPEVTSKSKGFEFSRFHHLNWESFKCESSAEVEKGGSNSFPEQLKKHSSDEALLVLSPSKGILFQSENIPSEIRIFENGNSEETQPNQPYSQLPKIFDEDYFSVLGQSCLQKHWVIEVSKSVDSRPCLRVVFYFDGANHQSSTRLSVKVADESQFNLVTQFVGAQTDGDSELISIHQGDYDVGNMAELNHWNIQEYSQKQYFLDRHYFHCHESSRVEQRNIHRGALHGQQRSYAQVDKEAYFEARSACELNSKQHIDLWFHNRHSDKSSVSDTSAHCVMRGESSVVFNGMIEITPKGEFTRAYQSHKTLMLSDNASVKSIPQLEIATDDVKCSHGASTSYLESDQLFYLQSRGFSKKEAEDCIAEAFTKNIYDNSPSVFVNKYLDKKQDAED